MLVPVTGSMYVRGETTPLETLLVDVGTGYLIEKSFEEAKVSVCSLSSSRLSHASLRGETHTDLWCITRVLTCTFDTWPRRLSLIARWR